MRAIYLFSKYAWVVSIKDKRGSIIVNTFEKTISKGKKTNKICVDQGSEFYNNSFKDFLKINDIKMYSTYNEGTSFVAHRFIRTLKNKIFKHMAAISENLYFHVLDDFVNKYNNTVHRTIKMKPIEVTSDSYAKTMKILTKKILNSKLVAIFAKRYAPNRLEEVFVVSGIKNTVPWTYVVSDLNGEEITGSFYEKELHKTSQEKFRIEKVLKTKGDKLYVKWKGYDNRFSSCINKNDLK